MQAKKYRPAAVHRCCFSQSALRVFRNMAMMGWSRVTIWMTSPKTLCNDLKWLPLGTLVMMMNSPVMDMTTASDIRPRCHMNHRLSSSLKNRAMQTATGTSTVHAIIIKLPCAFRAGLSSTCEAIQRHSPSNRAASYLNGRRSSRFPVDSALPPIIVIVLRYGLGIPHGPDDERLPIRSDVEGRVLRLV